MLSLDFSKSIICSQVLQLSSMKGEPDMIFVKSFTQARFQQIWKFTPITRKPQHVLPSKTPFKSKQMWNSPTVLLRYAFSLLNNIKLIKNYTQIFEITQDMSSPAEILPNNEIIYTSAACDACDKYHVCRDEGEGEIEKRKTFKVETQGMECAVDMTLF